MTASTELQLNGSLLIQQIQELGQIGADAEQGGRTRIALTDAEKSGRDLVVGWMRELDLDIQVDRIGNVFGTLRLTSDDGDQRPLMMGSHIDTVTNAGALDGCYGCWPGWRSFAPTVMPACCLSVQLPLEHSPMKRVFDISLI